MTIGVCEFGGSHLGVGLVHPDDEVSAYARLALDTYAPMPALLDEIAAATGPLVPHATAWAIAMPGPFDHAHGRGAAEAHHSGKFAAFVGQDLNAALRPLLGATPVWLNDAHAFGMGRYALTCATAPLFALTLGSGTGAAFVREGHAQQSGAGVPEGGEIYHLAHGESTLEKTFGPAALLTQAQGSIDPALPDFKGLCDRARADHSVASWLTERFAAFGTALAPHLRTFSPQTVSVGGSVCASWDLFGEAFSGALSEGLGYAPAYDIVTDTERSAMVGAAHHARR